MPTIRCQHCSNTLDEFLRVCPHCQRQILAASAIHFLGEGLSELLEECAESDPKLAKKKTTLYLKFCQKFLCDSEMALLSVKTYGGEWDERTLEAIEDVIESHHMHQANLKAVNKLISGVPLLAPVTKKVNLTSRRLDDLMQAWLHSDFGGRTFSG